MASDPLGPCARTPLYDLHVARGARMVPFAGFEMPVQYPTGILAEHHHTRSAAGLFDVSHMGQLKLEGTEAAAALETLVPGALRDLSIGRVRYTLFTDADGGILDDLMVTNAGDHLYLVVNAARRAHDAAHLAAHLPAAVRLVPLDDRALLALQGPAAVAVLGRLAPEAAELRFMAAGPATIDGIAVWVSRSGYTGEDGFELSVPADAAVAVAERLLAAPEVAPIGLGARDTLRLEAGLCLYGHDIDTTTTPIEAGLAWTIGKRRRAAADFPGASVILDQLANGPPRRRVGLRLDGRAPAREGAAIEDDAGTPLGTVTSGGVGPSAGAPIAMGTVAAAAATPGRAVRAVVRGRRLPATVVDLPFVQHRYHRG